MKKITFRQSLFVIITFACIVFFVSCEKDKDAGAVNLVSGTYSGTGTALNIPAAAPSSWSGNFNVYEDAEDGTFYSVTNWADKVLIYLNHKNGKIYLDLEKVLFEYDDLCWCLGVGYFVRENFYCSPTSFDYEVNYENKTNTLDFTGKIEGNTAFVGIVGRDKITGNGVTFAGDTFYSGAKLVLNSVNSEQ